jgi:hypothetical protein
MIRRASATERVNQARNRILRARESASSWDAGTALTHCSTTTTGEV